MKQRAKLAFESTTNAPARNLSSVIHSLIGCFTDKPASMAPQEYMQGIKSSYDIF
jgi:hypothetical protein